MLEKIIYLVSLISVLLFILSLLGEGVLYILLSFNILTSDKSIDTMIIISNILTPVAYISFAFSCIFGYISYKYKG